MQFKIFEDVDLAEFINGTKITEFSEKCFLKCGRPVNRIIRVVAYIKGLFYHE